ncbi:MAG: sulfatase-like hydrolase/transferase [Rubrivivax sp.]|nr:sulfatase-like hydrolase/transferase [Rubrivivax sp.]
MKPPRHIVLITSDQHRGDCYGFAGRRVHTPHLDALARGGTWLRNTITPNVVCQPARASMLTGLLPLTHGVRDNGIDLPEAAAAQGWAAVLARAGWATAFIGKAHFSTYHSYAPTGRPENVASAHRFPDSWFGPYMGFEHVELMLVGHNRWLPEPPPGGLHYERWYHADGRGAERNALYLERLPPATRAPQTHHSGLPVEWHNSTWTADRGIAFIERCAARRERFACWISFPDPHHPFDAPVPWSRLHDPAAVDLPPHRRRDLARRPWWHRAALEGVPETRADLRAIRETYSRMRELDDDELRELTANYYGMIALIDHQVGRIVARLQALGLLDETLLLFTSDHGDWLGDHGLVLKGPMHYDGLLRVGLLARGPGVPAGRVVTDPVSTLDLAATFFDLAGLGDAPGTPRTHGRSLAPVWRGEATRDHALNEWALGAARCGVALDLRTVRSARWRLTVERGSGAGELYDLRDDPCETVNRFDDPSCRDLRTSLEAALAARPDDALRTPLPQVGAA